MIQSVSGVVAESSQNPTARQANEGESLEVQQRQIEGYALMHGLSLAGVMVEEGVSGSVPVEERPVGGLLFAKLQSGDIVIAAKLDRLFRSALDALSSTSAATLLAFAAIRFGAVRCDPSAYSNAAGLPAD